MTTKDEPCTQVQVKLAAARRKGREPGRYALPQTTQRRLPAHGDIISCTYPGQSVPHHVVIHLGGDRSLQAPETGQNVGHGTLSEFPGQIATVRRITGP